MVSVGKKARRVALVLAALCLICSARADSVIENWSALQDAINSAKSGGTITLTRDVTAGESDTALVIPNGLTIKLDLNGFTLDRNQKAYGGIDGAAIQVTSGAVLTIVDSEKTSTGTITGGYSSDGGGIRNVGTLLLEGGCVTGNMAATAGGGIVNYGSLVVTGGTVTGNTAGTRGGGIYNAAKGYLTIGADTVFGNSAPREADIRNSGSMQIVGGDTVHFAALTDYLDLLSVMPVLVLLLILALTVWLDNNLDSSQKKVMYIICALVFTLILQSYWEYRLSLTQKGSILRTLAAVYGYAVRPAILAMFLYLLQPGRKKRAVWALIGVNAAIYLTALFSPLAFSFAKGYFEEGPLNRTCLIVSALLFAYLFILTIKVFHPRMRCENWLPIIVTVVIGASVALDYTVEYNEQPVSFLTIAIVISCVFYYIWLHLQFVREHEEALRAGQRIQLALSQIKPHFLYNALGAIEELCDSDPTMAKEATAKFSEYLRGNMDAIDRMNAIPFTSELEHTRLYLEIEQLRFRDALTIRYDIACSNFSLPALTLEPVVENAVRHGVRKNKRGIGSVSIATREAVEHYEISVVDDGPGFDPSALPDDGRSHVGIRNVRERLRSVCGGRLEIISEPGKGTIARIIIPKARQKGGEDGC